MVVVDASALAAVVFAEPAAPLVLKAIEGEELVAPALLQFELTNIARSKTLERLEAPVALSAMHQAGIDFPIEYVATDFGAVLTLAVETRLSAYDASYLWLSRHLRVPLVTLDKKLAAHAKKL